MKAQDMHNPGFQTPSDRLQGQALNRPHHCVCLVEGLREQMACTGLHVWLIMRLGYWPGSELSESSLPF